MTDGPGPKRDFFVSFNQADRAWATWIAWVLEEAGYSVWFQDWDFRGNFVEHMTRAHIQAHRTTTLRTGLSIPKSAVRITWPGARACRPLQRHADAPAQLEEGVPRRLGPLKAGSVDGLPPASPKGSIIT
jgi:hypothetical protein